MDNSSFYLPAEWEPQDGIMLTWPAPHTDWAPYLNSITNTYVTLVKAILTHERVIIATEDPLHTATILEKGGCAMERINLYSCLINDTWSRDHGPLTLVNPTDGSMRMLDFRFNGWGEKFDWQRDNAITQKLFSLHAFNAERESHDDFILEGGSIESDGKGTIFTTAQCLLAPHRNQPLSQQAIEEKLCKLLHAQRVIWIHHGNLIGDDTDGHIDTIVRACPDNTLIYVSCDDKTDEQYADFQALDAELQALQTMEGTHYRLLKLPMPDRMEFDGERLPATYANFLIINGAVIVPIYGQKEKDEEALTTIAQAFPEREIIPIDASVIVRQHGSIHCLTMQIPHSDRTRANLCTNTNCTQ